jgi:hypothetical protein
MTSDVSGIEILSRKASQREGFLGSVLLTIATENQISMSDVASRIKCPPENLSLLSLCKTPRDAAEYFASDIKKLSEYSGCDGGELANVVREYQAIRVMREMEPTMSSHETMLMAARDKKPRSLEDDDSHE